MAHSRMVDDGDGQLAWQEMRQSIQDVPDVALARMKVLDVVSNVALACCRDGRLGLAHEQSARGQIRMRVCLEFALVQIGRGHVF